MLNRMNNFFVINSDRFLNYIRIYWRYWNISNVVRVYLGDSDYRVYLIFFWILMTIWSYLITSPTFLRFMNIVIDGWRCSNEIKRQKKEVDVIINKMKEDIVEKCVFRMRREPTKDILTDIVLEEGVSDIILGYMEEEHKLYDLKKGLDKYILGTENESFDDLFIRSNVSDYVCREVEELLKFSNVMTFGTVLIDME